MKLDYYYKLNNYDTPPCRKRMIRDILGLKTRFFFFSRVLALILRFLVMPYEFTGNFHIAWIYMSQENCHIYCETKPYGFTEIWHNYESK